MASGDDKQEEEEFKDIPSEVDGDALEVGNTSAQEKFDKLKKAVKESSKDNGKKSKKEDKKKENTFTISITVFIILIIIFI
jgi:hypothetical protein